MPTPRRSNLISMTRAAVFLLAGVGLVLASTSAMAAETDTSDASWLATLGRMHVVVLHLPIGLLLGAFAIEAIGYFKRSKGFDLAATWLFILGAASSVPAVVTGLLRASEKAVRDDVTPTIWQVMFASDNFAVSETLGWHLWAGIIVMLAAIAAAVLKPLAVKRQWQDDESTAAPGGWPLAVSRLSLLGAMAILPLAGHLGGNVTHGRDFLFARSPIAVPEWVINFPPEHADDVEGGGAQFGSATIAWNEKIQPQLNDHCIACHGPDDQSGDLRLDSLQWTLEGGNAGPAIEAGEARYSELYVRVSLPVSHDEYMPPNDKLEAHGQLTAEEVAFIGEWIQNFDGSVE